MIVLAASSAGCETPAPLRGNDGGPMPLACATPIMQDLVAPTSGSNAGVPMAGIIWAAGRCHLTTDEHEAGLVLLFADFTGSALVGAPVATAGNDWRIESSTAGGSGSYVLSPPRDTDLTFVMASATERVTLVVRLTAANVLVLTDMRRS